MGFDQRVPQRLTSFLTVQIGDKGHQAHPAPFGQRKSGSDRFFHRDQYDQQQKFDRDPYLKTVYLTGELSNFRLRQRHQYFSIKDENAVIDAVMFERQFRQVNFRPETGSAVLT